MELKLSSPILDVPRVGPVKAKQLAKIDILQAKDFLYHFPSRYEDFSRITKISNLEVGEPATVNGRLKKVNSKWGFQGRRRLLRIFAEVEDDTGVLTVMWFNLSFLEKQLWVGREIMVAGVVEEKKNGKEKKMDSRAEKFRLGFSALRMRSPAIEFPDQNKEKTHTGRITPIYPETRGVTSRFLRTQVKSLLPLVQLIPEYLPKEIRERHNLMGIQEAIQERHFPRKMDRRKKAEARLKFDELFFLQLASLVRQQERAKREALVVKAKPKVHQDFLQKIGFELTGSQRKVMKEIEKDLALGEPMNRLLQGDVGSGKSVVAQYAAALALDSGFKVLYLAPTEVLARQQAKSFAKVLGQDKVALLIGAMRKSEKNFVKNQLQRKEPIVVVGTHALLQEDVVTKNCALVIVDEQHRFGVGQRKVLQEQSDDKFPHLLSMTATPIPRTLSLTVYGDLDVSVLDEMPKGRKEIKTKIVGEEEKHEAVTHILEELHAGRQAYVIAPLVEQSEKLEAKSAKETYAEMKEYFPDVAVGILHGKMTSEEKEAALNNFTAGAIQLLVATAVVEVGVNVPNATIMIIEGAERFGLAQLHQFRGRIGRGEEQSYCYLFPNDSKKNSKRLNILEQTTDGFLIAEEDLKLRGPGEVYGTSQSGFDSLQVATLLDYDLIQKTREEAKGLLNEDPELKNYPLLAGKVKQKNLVTHFE